MRINVDDFSDTSHIDQDMRRRLAVAALSDERRDPSVPEVYDVYWRVFTGAMTEFKEARAAAARHMIQHDRAKLPRGVWLILGDLPTDYRRHLAALALSGERSHTRVASTCTDLLGSGQDGGDPRSAARQIVGSCWPRFRRALTIVHAATDYLQRVPVGTVDYSQMIE